MHLHPFELHRPATVAETVRLTAGLSEGFEWLAGGTDLLPNYKMHLNARAHLVALEGIRELHERGPGRIGAMVRLAELERDAGVGASYPALRDAVREVATPLVRESATVGGNLFVETRCFFFNQSLPWRASLGYCLKAEGDLCHVVPQKERCYATFSGDLAPALAVLDATVELAGPDGLRTVPLLDLYDAEGDGIRRVRLRPRELAVAVGLPGASVGLPSSYQKLRIRPAFDFPELGLAAAGRFDDGRVVSLALAAGGLESYPRRFDALTQPLLGERLSDDRIRDLAEAVRRSVRPVHNTYLAPDYRRRMVAVFVRRALARLLRPPPGAAS